MQKCGFSETQFSFCFTFEYLKRFFPVIPLPIFPSTVMEGKAGGGYDVQINGNLFFQFKIPVRYDKENNFIRQKWNCFGGPYYSGKISTDSEQFRLLKVLKSSANIVCYVLPEFHTSKKLEQFYSANSLVSNSAMFEIEQFPSHKSGHHHLIYDHKSTIGFLFSERVEMKKLSPIHPAEYFPLRENKQSVLEGAHEIARRLKLNDFRTSTPMPNFDGEPDRFVKWVYTILLVDFNVHWYPVITQ